MKLIYIRNYSDMWTKPFFDYLSRLEKTDQSFYELVRPLLEKIDCDDAPVGLLNPGEVQTDLFFVLSGEATVFHYRNEKRTVTRLLCENDFAAAAESLFQGKTSTESIEAKKGSCIMKIPYKEIKERCKDSTLFVCLERDILLKSLLRVREYEHILRMDTVETRYHYIRKKHRRWIERFAVKDVAGMIGVADETLSRIRKTRKRPSTANKTKKKGPPLSPSAILKLSANNQPPKHRSSVAELEQQAAELFDMICEGKMRSGKQAAKQLGISLSKTQRLLRFIRNEWGYPVRYSKKRKKFLLPVKYRKRSSGPL